MASINDDGDGYSIRADESYTFLELYNLFNCKPQFMKYSIANRLDSKINIDKI